MKVKGRIWLEHNDQIILGLGRVQLLEQIAIDGSINSACKSLNMSYKKAWKLVDSMNTVADEPLVEKVSGGKGGGGTRVTDFGKEMIQKFRTAEANTKQFFKSESEQFD